MKNRKLKSILPAIGMLFAGFAVYGYEINQIIRDTVYSSPGAVEEIAISSLITNGPVVVEDDADVTFRSAQVKLNEGFEVESGGAFEAATGDQSAFMYFKEFSFDKGESNTLFFNPLVMSSLDCFFHYNTENRNFHIRVNELTNAGESYIVADSGYSNLTAAATADPAKYSFNWDGKIVSGMNRIYVNEGRCRLFLVDSSTGEVVDYMDMVIDFKLSGEELQFLNDYKNRGLSPEKEEYLSSLVQYAVYAETSSLYNALLEIYKFLDDEIREIYSDPAFNMYNLMINYKELTRDDIEQLARSELNILSRNQGEAARKIKELSAGGTMNFGYVDGAGVSAFEPECFYLDESTGTAYLLDEEGTVIVESSAWFIRDSEGGYCNYWNGTGYMMHISHPDYRKWFFSNRVDSMIDDFDGIFLDDIWSNIYDGLEMIDDTTVFYENSTSDWLGDTWLTDYSASWTANEFAGKKLFVNGKTALITGNSDTVLWITDNGINETGGGIAYRIVDTLYQDQVVNWLGYGETYAESMIKFLAELKNHLSGHGNELIVNMWLDNEELTPDYAEHADYIVNEALTHSWNMDNFVTRQTVFIDSADARERLTKQLSGHSTKLITIAYPFNNQTHLELVAANLLFSPWDRENDEPRAYVTASNINLSQVYLNEIMTADIGRPEGELIRRTTSDGEQYMHRRFENGLLFYNPGRHEISFHFDLPFNGCTYPERDLLTSGTREIRMAARSAVYVAESGSDFYTELVGSNNYTKKDGNAAFIIFTEAGMNNIGYNSVWIDDGFSNNKYFIFDGDAEVPEGESVKLFHAGDGTASGVAYRNPISETSTAAGRTLGSRDVYAVVEVRDVLSGVVLERNTDYKLRRSAYEILTGEQANWDTIIEVLTPAYFDHDLAVKYYDKSVEGYYYTEHGILYRNNQNTALYTGDINQVDCTSQLIEGIDYYTVPEITVWQWDYRSPDVIPSAVNSYTLNTRDLKPEWGSVDVRSIILVNPEETGPGEKNGSMVKISESDVELKRPRILVYGFRSRVRERGSGETILPAEREIDEWNPESMLKKDEGILFDQVVVTGDYDEYGSIEGFLNSEDNTIGGLSALQDYFDAVVITDPLLEQPGREIADWNNFTPVFHPNGKGDFESWLGEPDYDLISGFSKMIIDKRGGIKSFEWYADRTYVMPPEELVFTYKYVKSELPSLYTVFGIHLIEGQNVGTDYIPGSSYRMLYTHMDGISDNHYTAGELLNGWEEGNSYASFIPKFRRDLQTGRIYNNFINGSDGSYHTSFVVEQATGNIAATAYYHGNPEPNILCLGINYADLVHLIKHQLGTEITFSNLDQYRDSEDLQLYYNVLTDNLTYQYAYSQETLYSDEVDSGAVEVILRDFTTTPGQELMLSADIYGTGPFSYEWTLGDGTDSQSEEPAHTYYHENPDNSVTDYLLSLTVTDAGSNTYTVTSRVRVVNTSSGILAVDEVWSGEHTIAGDLTIPPGVELTIQPGTVIRVTSDASGQTDHQIIINGEATVENAGLMLLSGDSQMWKGIYVTGNAAFNNCIIEDAMRGITIAPGAGVSVDGCTFRGNRIGIHVISNNTTIANCNFLDQVYYGVKEDGSCSVEVDDSVFMGNLYYNSTGGVISVAELNAVPGNSGNSGE